MSEDITITKEEYLSLKCAQEELDRLEVGGVDNWEWYEDSLNPDGSLSLDDYKEKLKKDIFKS
ncbi:MAG: hypothetical protein E2O29_01855 [Deltaproteobacteria bacterium]|nr:MAG: hypothetical protein E2O29_01855 [Deltaproteobacteria bacterium]